jgi:hypothetical protein
MITGCIVIEATKQNDGLVFYRDRTYAVQHRGVTYSGMRAFRSKRKGTRVIVFKPTEHTIAIKGMSK